MTVETATGVRGAGAPRESCVHRWVVAAERERGGWPARCRRCGAERCFSGGVAFGSWRDEQLGEMEARAARAEVRELVARFGGHRRGAG